MEKKRPAGKQRAVVGVKSVGGGNEHRKWGKVKVKKAGKKNSGEV